MSSKSQDKYLKDLAGAISSIDANRLDEQISVDSSQEELKGLAAAINQMLNRINDSYQSQVQFVSDGYAYYYAVNAADGEIVKVTKTPVGEEPIQAQPEQTTDTSASQTGEATRTTAGTKQFSGSARVTWKKADRQSPLLTLYHTNESLRRLEAETGVYIKTVVLSPTIGEWIAGLK